MPACSRRELGPVFCGTPPAQPDPWSDRRGPPRTEPAASSARPRPGGPAGPALLPPVCFHGSAPVLESASLLRVREVCQGLNCRAPPPPPPPLEGQLAWVLGSGLETVSPQKFESVTPVLSALRAPGALACLLSGGRPGLLCPPVPRMGPWIPGTSLRGPTGALPRPLHPGLRGPLLVPRRAFRRVLRVPFAPAVPHPCLLP